MDEKDKFERWMMTYRNTANPPRIEADLGVYRWRWGRFHKGKELVDEVFGLNRHHLRILGGPREFCEGLIYDFMKFLGVDDMFIEPTYNIP